MESELVLVDREALPAELRRVFDAQTAEVLLGVLDKVAVQVRAAGVAREDFGELKQVVAELAEIQRRCGLHLEQLESALRTLVEQVRALTQAQQQTRDAVSDLKELLLESTYRDKVTAYFLPLLWRARLVSYETLDEVLEAHLSDEELEDALLLDLVVSGQPRQHPAIPEVWLAVEVAAVVDEGVVSQARRGAALLGRAVHRAIPVVAGEQVTLRAEAEARLHKVVVLQDQRSFLWEDALEAWAMA